MESLVNSFTSNSWMIQVFVVVLLTLIGRFVLKIVLDRFGKKLDETATRYDEALLEVARKPLGWAIWVIGILEAAEIVKTATQAEIFDFIDPTRKVAIITLLAWFTVRFTRRAADFIQNSRESDDDRHTIDVVAKLVRVSVVITAFLITLQSLGFSIEGVLAFGGIGGIAVGFAAKDLLANFFGALMILLDKPFAVGEWILSPDQEIEGTVEDIGWRVTRIRTFDKRPLFVPNATFTSITVENPSRMLNRRIYETIGVRYDDIAVLPEILQDIRSMLMNHVEIDTNQTLMVNLNVFGPSTVDFFIYTFTKETNWVRFHAIKEEILFLVSEIIVNRGAEIAFPTQTLHVEGPSVGPTP